jgi:hypothetical protein
MQAQRIPRREQLKCGRKIILRNMVGIGKTAPIVRCRTFDFSTADCLATPEEHAYSDSGMAEIHSLREKKVRDEIANRLRRVCSIFSDDEFEKLVTLMAARQVRCERRQTW